MATQPLQSGLWNSGSTAGKGLGIIDGSARAFCSDGFTCNKSKPIWHPPSSPKFDSMAAHLLQWLSGTKHSVTTNEAVMLWLLKSVKTTEPNGQVVSTLTNASSSLDMHERRQDSIASRVPLGKNGLRTTPHTRDTNKFSWT